MTDRTRENQMNDEPGRKKYPNVFEPVRIGPVEVKNRVFMGPHTIPLETHNPADPGYNIPSADAAHYYAERARNGVGLLFHSQNAGPFAPRGLFSSTPWFDSTIPSYARIADGVHDHGARIMAQLVYTGVPQNFWTPLGATVPFLRPSPEPHFLFPMVGRQMTKREIGLLADCYGRSTRNLRSAGYDGVEVHASHGAIFEHFVSSRFNSRTDEYGGSLANRLRALNETLEAVREGSGGEMAVGIRFTADQLLEGGWDLDEAQEILAAIAATGLLDFVDIDIAVEPEQPEMMTTSPFFDKLHNAERVAFLAPSADPLVVLGVPGQLADLRDAQALLAGGAMDMVGAVRSLIAEPELVSNALMGRESHSRHCIKINACFEAAGGWGFGCAINPTVGSEEEWGTLQMRPATTSMGVVVVGGGPGGLEAARVAALRGHRVTLLERSSALGGGLRLWSKIPDRGHLGRTIGWFETEIRELGVDIRTGVDADVAAVLACEPDVVIVATGSRYSPAGVTGLHPQGVPGWQSERVVSPEAVIEGNLRLSGRVIVVDDEGLHTGAGVAELAAGNGAEVELVIRKSQPVPGVHDAERGAVIARLRKAGVLLTTSTAVTRVEDSQVMLHDLTTNEARVVDDVDWIVFATARQPENALETALEGRVDYVYVIGDALAPRRLREATFEGHRFARLIGEEAMPRDVSGELFRPFSKGPRPAELA